MQTPHAQEPRLSVDSVERAIDALEMAHFAAVKAWWEEQQTGEPDKKQPGGQADDIAVYTAHVPTSR